MKVVIAGSTGLVGSALVRQSIASDSISHVYALSRKPLPEAVAKSPKVSVILHDDYSSYPDELLDQLAGVEGCFWWDFYLSPLRYILYKHGCDRE